MSDEEYVMKSGKVLTAADLEALADEAERGYDPDRITPLIVSEWQEHRQVWEVLARPSADEPWTRLEGFDRKPLMERAREIAFPDRGKVGT